MSTQTKVKYPPGFVADVTELLPMKHRFTELLEASDPRIGGEIAKFLIDTSFSLHQHLMQAQNKSGPRKLSQAKSTDLREQMLELTRQEQEAIRLYFLWREMHPDDLIKKDD